jgi:predicted membrane protein
MTIPLNDSDASRTHEANRATLPPRRFTPQALVGVIVIVLGVLFTLDNLNLIDAADYLQYWPAGLVAVGLLKLWQARAGPGIAGGLFLVVLGSWMLLERIVAIQIRLHDVWPLFLVFVGGYLVWKGFGVSSAKRVRAADSNARISGLAIMAGIVRGNNSPVFEGGDLTAIMGGCEIDLRQASIAPGTDAVIDVFAFWGGIEIRVPEDWTVVSRVTPLMGGLEDKTRPSSNASKRLVLRGFAIMGGIGVKN